MYQREKNQRLCSNTKKCVRILQLSTKLHDICLKRAKINQNQAKTHTKLICDQILVTNMIVLRIAVEIGPEIAEILSVCRRGCLKGS